MGFSGSTRQVCRRASPQAASASAHRTGRICLVIAEASLRGYGTHPGISILDFQISFSISQSAILWSCECPVVRLGDARAFCMTVFPERLRNAAAEREIPNAR